MKTEQKKHYNVDSAVAGQLDHHCYTDNRWEPPQELTDQNPSAGDFFHHRNSSALVVKPVW